MVDGIIVALATSFLFSSPSTATGLLVASFWTWLPTTPAPWYSNSCGISSLWMQTRPGDMIPTSRIWQKSWNVISVIRLQDCNLCLTSTPPLAGTLLLFHLLALMKPAAILWNALQTSPQGKKPGDAPGQQFIRTEDSVQEFLKNWILLPSTWVS